MKKLFFLLFALVAFSASAQTVTEIDDIWDVRYNRRPMVIDAYASWCQPCRVYSPIVERLAREYAGRVDFYKVDVDNPDAEDFVVRYEINSVPTTVFLWDPLGDATVKSHVERGLMSYGELKQQIELALSKQYKVDHTGVGLSWSDQTHVSGFTCPVEYESRLQPFLGEWIGREDGAESRLWFEKDGDVVEYHGGTLASGRVDLVGTAYWCTLGFYFDDDGNLCASDVLPDKPVEIVDLPRNKSGILYERMFKVLSSGNLQMSVRAFKLSDGHVDRQPFKSYTVDYRRVG